MAHRESALFDYCVALPIIGACLVAILPLVIIDDPTTAARFVRRAAEPALRLGTQVVVGAVAVTLIPPLFVLEMAEGVAELAIAIAYHDDERRS